MIKVKKNQIMSATTFNVTAPPATNRLSLAPPATNRLHLAPLSHLSRHLLPPLRSLPPLTFDTLLLFFPSFERLYLLILLHSQLFTSLIVRSLMFCFDKTNKVERTERRWLIAGHLHGRRRPCLARAGPQPSQCVLP